MRPLTGGEEKSWCTFTRYVKSVTRDSTKSRVYSSEFEGTYVPFPRFSFGMSSKDLHEYLLRDAKVALTPGSNYGSKGEGHLRICIATSGEIINETIDRIQASLNRLQPQ